MFKIRKICLSIGILIIFFLITMESGCIGVQKSNLTVAIPENVETSIGKQEVLLVEILPLEADAKDVLINLSAPSGISLTDPHINFQQYSKELKTLTKDQKIIIPFNFSAVSDGTFNLNLEITSTNANTTNRSFTVNAYVPAPKLEIGEFWIYNQTKGNAIGLQVEEVISKDTIIDGKEYYVIKRTWEGEPMGTYALSYYSGDTFSEKMKEQYEDGSLLKEKTLELDPPSSEYVFPFKVGMKGSWNGSITGMGKSEINTEVVKKETITVPSGTYTSYYIKQKISFTMATGVGEMWYVPELNGFAKSRISTNALGITSEDEAELLEHGKPPAKPRQIQPDMKIPDGYKLYKNNELNFRIAYPKNWEFSLDEGIGYSSFYFKDSMIYEAAVTVESIGKLNLTEYRDFRMEYLKKLVPGVKISEVKSVTINGRDGFEWIFEYPLTNEKAKQVIFVADGNGYIVSGYSLSTVYDSYKSMFDNIVNSFFIKGNPNKYTLS